MVGLREPRQAVEVHAARWPDREVELGVLQRDEVVAHGDHGAAKKVEPERAEEGRGVDIDVVAIGFDQRREIGSKLMHIGDVFLGVVVSKANGVACDHRIFWLQVAIAEQQDRHFVPLGPEEIEQVCDIAAHAAVEGRG